MKKPYQIESQRAVKRFEEMAAAGNTAVQMVLPMAEMVGWLREGVGELVRQAGLQLMQLLMEEEVRELAGERSQRPTRLAFRIDALGDLASIPRELSVAGQRVHKSGVGSAEEALAHGPESRSTAGSRLLGAAVACQQRLEVDALKLRPTIDDDGLR